MNYETQYYKDYDFTYKNKRDITGIFKTIKTKYKQLKSRTHDMNFNKTKYDMHGDSSLWKFSIYDNKDKNVLYLIEYGVTRIEHKNGYPNISTKPYTKEEQDIKNICS